MRRPLPVFSALFAALLAAVTVLPAGAVAGTTVKTATNTAKGPTNTANKPPLARKELLDTLPMQPAEPLTAEMRRLMPENRQKPRDVDLAVRLAHVYYRQAVREGELRFVGYARSVLAP